MMVARIAVALVLAVVMSSVGVGAATTAVAQTQTPDAPPEAMPLGEHVSTVLQSNAAQTEATVENGMWEASFANASNTSAKRQLVERRTDALDGSLAELQADRRALRAAYENGSIDRVTYRARLSRIVGRLAALDEGIETTSDRGRSVGVNVTRLDELRSQASELGGAEVSRLARNLTGGPGPSGIFDEGHPSDERGNPDAANQSNQPPAAGGPDDAGNESRIAVPPIA